MTSSRAAGCTAIWSPALQGLSTVVTGALSAGGDAAGAVQLCRDFLRDIGADAADPLTEIERKTLCGVMCCCRTPGGGSSQHEHRQDCVAAVLGDADAALGWKSRYKAEISYDMISGEVPQPLMHRGPDGEDTTEPSRYWQGRARKIDGYEPGEGDVRRPDVVIVKDNRLPPITSKNESESNVERVVEMKFDGDRWGPGQREDYEEIAGSANKLTEIKQSDCGCGNNQPRRVPVTVPAIVPATEPAWSWRDVAEVGAFGVATLGLAALTVAAIVSPVEGPAGEVAAGTATLGAASRFGAAWQRVFGGPWATARW